MKFLRNSILFAVVCVFAMSSVSAMQDGAIVVRGEDTGWLQGHWNEEEGEASVISWNSANSEFDFCGVGGDDNYWNYRWLFRPGDVFNYHVHGLFFVRVWQATIEDYLSQTNGGVDICLFINNGEHVAEGIVQATYFDNDVSVAGPGTNVWGHHYSGHLTSLSPSCGSGMVGFNLIRRWKILPDETLKLQVFLGPQVSCIRN